jgi:hypothetical protein
MLRTHLRRDTLHPKRVFSAFYNTFILQLRHGALQQLL